MVVEQIRKSYFHSIDSVLDFVGTLVEGRAHARGL